MNLKITIQKLLASLLLVLFTVSFIPKSYFHDVIATHTDAVVCEHPPKETTCLHERGFNCSFNDLVVTAPYVPFAIRFDFSQLSFPVSSVSNYYRFIFQSCFFNTDSRGPPVANAS